MTRQEIVERIGQQYLTTNTEEDEYSYVAAIGSRAALKKALNLPEGTVFRHQKIDRRFVCNDVVVLVETKKSFRESDQKQLSCYVDEEIAVHHSNKIIAILANTNNNKIRVWKSQIDDEHLLKDETVLDNMSHYAKLFEFTVQNDREIVLRNTYALNELLHKKDISENLRSQFVGTTLLYVKDMVNRLGSNIVDEKLVKKLNDFWNMSTASDIRSAIGETLLGLLDGSENKEKKIALLKKNVLENQKVLKLSKDSWIEILNTILKDIFKYINADSSEGQDILNMFFIAFNKYTGKADKNQAFTPDHITDFMCRITDVDCSKVVLDATCGSGSFLVQAMAKELVDCRKNRTDEEARRLSQTIKESHIFGIENEEIAYGLATTNMLIHSDGNSNIKFASVFDSAKFIKDANPDIILMNPPYNAKPIEIPKKYKESWGDAKDGKEDPTKGLVFVQFLSDVLSEINKDRVKKNQPPKVIKMAVLLPVAVAIGSSSILSEAKAEILKSNRLEAVFTLPEEIFYPGANVHACCMVFSLGIPHKNADETVNKTFFGYYKEDGFKKKKNLGRIEQFDENGLSKWKAIREQWVSLYRNKEVVDGLSSQAIVNGESEWLCEAYMETDYSKLISANFQHTVNDFLSYKFKSNRIINSENPNCKEWKSFNITDLFTPKRGSISTLNEVKEGAIPIVSASGVNEGIDFYGDVEAPYNNNITVSMNGKNTGFTAYHNYDFNINSDCCVLLQKFEMNQYIGLFIATIINQLRYKYSYGRKMSAERLALESILLPAKHNPDGSLFIDEKCVFSKDGYVPDWNYMEEYIKQLPFGETLA